MLLGDLDGGGDVAHDVYGTARRVAPPEARLAAIPPHAELLGAAQQKRIQKQIRDRR
jgi:hypothetical protein